MKLYKVELYEIDEVPMPDRNGVFDKWVYSVRYYTPEMVVSDKNFWGKEIIRHRRAGFWNRTGPLFEKKKDAEKYIKLLKEKKDE